MAFNDATRREVQMLPQLAKATGGGNTVRVDLPRVGLLQYVFLAIRGTVAGTVNTANGLGMASIVRQVRLTANNGNDIFNMSGVGYNYLLRPHLDIGDDPLPQSTAYSAVTATTFNLDMILPVAVNMRDPIGLLMLQSDQTLITLQVTFETDVTVGGSTATYHRDVHAVRDLFHGTGEQRRHAEPEHSAPGA